MKVSLEFLFHYQCDFCSKWWSIADITPLVGNAVRCPHCDKANKVEEIATVENQQPTIQALKDLWR